ncbi:hypothetical protein PNP59_05755 [Halobacterium salinarum]|uniref:hypothetical protein n=1 Tax=Halobacterium salinarum TaxID=2242 RepID=UPI00255669E4|nr:hypothetical protein [Halobacterium salinarum]MDL0130445.1 hypothetical protein [Halobacterium salinarum]
MQIDTNAHGDRIAYDYPYADTLTEREEELYWEATKKAEDAIARIAKVQEQRQITDGDINSALLSDEFRKLRKAMDKLQEAITTFHLLKKGAPWSEDRDSDETVLGGVFKEDRENE